MECTKEHFSDEQYIKAIVLYHDTSEEAVKLVGDLCDQDSVVRIKSIKIDIIEFIHNPLFSTIDICAIFLSENPDNRGLTGYHIAERIFKAGLNIPIFIRTEQEQPPELTPEQQSYITAVYNSKDPIELKRQAERFLFGMHYPPVLVNRIQQIGVETINYMISDVKVIPCRPFLSQDFSITNHFTSVIPFDSPCCKGYIMLQMLQNNIITLISQSLTSLNPSNSDNDSLNQFIGETLNLFWGKLRFALKDQKSESDNRIYAQVPMSINYINNYISFGRVMPQLCFRYLIYQSEKVSDPMVFDFKVIFNSYSPPSNVIDSNDELDRGVENGEFELF